MSFREAKKYPRLRVFSRAEIRGEVIIHNDEHLFIAPIVNISAGGLFAKNLMNLPKGSSVRLVVKSTQLEKPVQAEGTVVRIEDNGRKGVAVEFTSISTKARELIQNCVYEARMDHTLKVA